MKHISFFLFFAIVFLFSIISIVGNTQETSHNKDILDLELIDELDENEETVQDIRDTDSIVISNITVFIDNVQYNNPGSKDSPSHVDSIKPELVMKEITFRKGDSMNFLALHKSLYFSLNNLKTSPYFQKTENGIDYISLEEKDILGHHKIKVFIYVKRKFPFSFGGGNSFASFGVLYPIGLQTRYSVGANRVEANIVYEGINIGAKEYSYSHVFMDIGIRTLWHWLFPSLDTKLKRNTFLYGALPHVGFSIFPFRFSTAIGFFGSYSLENKKNNDDSFNTVNLPNTQQGVLYTLDIRNTLEMKQTFGSTEMHEHYLEFQVPYMIGTVLQSNKPSLPQGQIFDLLAVIMEAQVGFHFGLYQAIHLKGGIGSNIASTKNPYTAKVNVYRTFYDSLAFPIANRGTYPEKVSIGNKGGVGNIEYRIGLFRAGIFALESFVFYDVGTVANEVNDLKDNIRHAVGPGLVFHFFSPIDLMARTGFAFGGALLNQPDGAPFSFSIEIKSRR